MEQREIITRRNLPHWYVPDAVHFVTYRLAGAIPIHVVRTFRDERKQFLENAPSGASLEGYTKLAHSQFFAKYDGYLDTHRKIAWLGMPEVAAMIRGNLYHHDEKKYHLLAYCIMPNHVHVLFQPIDLILTPEMETQYDDEGPDARSPLAKILHSLKSYTANEANQLLGHSGRFWQRESYDHWVRDVEELGRTASYIAANPVKANLANVPHEWFFSSAHDTFLSDGRTQGLLYYPR